MDRRVLLAARNWFGRSQRVINALDQSDTDSTFLASTVDARVRLAEGLDAPAAQTLVLIPQTGESDPEIHKSSTFLQVACYGRTQLDALRIRDAVRRDAGDFRKFWIQLAADVGSVKAQSWAGDGAVTFSDSLQLWRADGSVRLVIQYHY